jgi:hypothetical protein
MAVLSQAAGTLPASAQGVQCGPPKRLASPPPVRPPSVRSEGRGAAPGAGIAMQPVCPQGLVPLVKTLPPDASGVIKGNPLLGPGANRRGGVDPTRLLTFEQLSGLQQQDALENPKCDGVDQESEQACYYYGVAAAQRTFDGAGMTFSINRPRYFGSGHTLAELAVMGGEKNGDIVEIGWNVSTHQYEGSADPHLFVFHWQDWQGTCYDGCGWEQVSQKFYPGQDLSALVGKEVSAGFAFHEGNWWAWFADEWIGYFPAEEWEGKYTQAKLVHWFGEVASHNGIPPQMEMGAGVFPTQTEGARLRDLCDWDLATKSCKVTQRFSVLVNPPGAKKYYGAKKVGASDVRYGGPGREVPVADQR